MAQRIAANAAGTRLWVAVTQAGTEAPVGITVYDVSSGAPLATNPDVVPLYGGGRLPLIVNERAGELLAVTADGLVALDSETLQVKWTADAPTYREGPQSPGSAPWFDAYVELHPDARAIYVHEGSAREQGAGPWSVITCHQAAVIALDAATGARLATRPALGTTGTPLCTGVNLAAIAAPSRPLNFHAEVSGRRVTLSWDHPVQATHYEVEAGSAPGLRDLLRVVPNTVPLVVDNVPPGIYYVRVRALNYAGKGAYTEDITVVVQ